jgi:transcriptional regulator of acetoin/glycerol metabolism
VAAYLVHWTEGDEVGLADLPRRLFEPAAAATGGSLHAIEREVLERTLGACGGNASAAARRLGIGRSTIYRRLRHPHD